MDGGFLRHRLLEACCWVGRGFCCTFSTKKKRGFRLLSFHALRLSHCPIFRNDNAKPTLICYIYLYHNMEMHKNTPPHRYDYNIPVGHLTLLSPLNIFEICEISMHQNKASINAYNYMSVRPTLYEI